METSTVWPEDLPDVEPAEKQRLADQLHADAKPCAQLDYIRTHSGFCRRITVTEEDLQRLRGAESS